MMINKKGVTQTNKYPSHAPTKTEQHARKTACFSDSRCQIEREVDSLKTKKSTTATTYFHLHHGTNAKSMGVEAGICLRWQEFHLQISC